MEKNVSVDVLFIQHFLPCTSLPDTAGGKGEELCQADQFLLWKQCQHSRKGCQSHIHFSQVHYQIGFKYLCKKVMIYFVRIKCICHNSGFLLVMYTTIHNLKATSKSYQFDRLLLFQMLISCISGDKGFFSCLIQNNVLKLICHKNLYYKQKIVI